MTVLETSPDSLLSEPDEDISSTSLINLGLEPREETGPNGEKWIVFADPHRELFARTSHIEPVVEPQAQPRKAADDLGSFVMNHPEIRL